METYKVNGKQNIYDIAIALYGTVEGVADLLINNPGISFETEFKTGDEIIWGGDSSIYNQLPASIKREGVLPANHERHVYFKEIEGDPKICLIMPSDSAGVVWSLSGDGQMIVDWGDNSDVETIALTSHTKKYDHYFDNTVNKRRVFIYGNFNIKEWDCSKLTGNIILLEPVTVDEFKIDANNMSLDALFLFKDTYSVTVTDRTLSSLTQFADMNLQLLDLTGTYFTGSCLDEYLIYLAKNNNQRRNCKVILSTRPSGKYEEPPKDQYGNYIISNGMQAIFVILHEPTWNEGGPWKFIIQGAEFSADNLTLAYRLSFILE